MKKRLKPLNESVGEVDTFNITNDKVELFTSGFSFEITQPFPGIFRVFGGKKEGVYPPNPYSVLSPVKTQKLAITEEENKIVVRGLDSILNIHLSPLRVELKDNAGNILNRDHPEFGMSMIGQEVTIYKEIQKDEKFLGLGEKTGPQNKRNQAFVNWNTDYFAYPTNGDPLYLSIPFFLGTHNEGCYGIFFDNTHKSTFNFGASNNRFAYFSAVGGNVDYYLISGKNPLEIISRYSTLTGKMKLPPIWALGYQQCRYSYYPEHEIISLAKSFRDRKIPADVLYLDIHYMEKYKVFSFDKKRFPQPKKLIEDLDEKGFKTVVIVDPGVKVEKGYSTYDEGMEKDLFVKYPDGSPFSAEVWPGWSHFPDFTNPKCREWWADKVDYYNQLGLKGYWNDMNEPACWGQHMPELIEFEFEGETTTHSEARNVYGMQMARSTYDGAAKNTELERPFILTRSGFAGIQRYAAVWTGDNVASSEHMMLGLRLVMGLGLSGVPFSGFDVGGFVGEASPELFARWMSVAAFCPFFRGHSMINTKDSEPWSFGEEVEEICRNYITLRYSLIPSIYSLFHEASTDGTPIMRSLALYHPNAEWVYKEEFENQFLLGSFLLVCPAAEGENLTRVFLPQGKWYDFYNNKIVEGPGEIIVKSPKERLPVFVKESAILIREEPSQSLSKRKALLMEIHLYFGKKDSEFIYFEDDGKSNQFEKGVFHRRKIEFNAQNKTLTLSAPEGNMKSRYQKLKLFIHGQKSLATSPVVKINGQEHKVDKESLVQMPAISNFDPFITPSQPEQAEMVYTLETPYPDTITSIDL